MIVWRVNPNSVDIVARSHSRNALVADRISQIQFLNEVNAFVNGL
jgi:hypothetical protein